MMLIFTLLFKFWLHLFFYSPAAADSCNTPKRNSCNASSKLAYRLAKCCWDPTAKKSEVKCYHSLYSIMLNITNLCSRCGDDHDVSNSETTEVTCCLCWDKHSAAYKGCPKFKDAFEVQKVVNKVSDADALKQIKLAKMTMKTVKMSVPLLQLLALLPRLLNPFLSGK